MNLSNPPTHSFHTNYHLQIFQQMEATPHCSFHWNVPKLAKMTPQSRTLTKVLLHDYHAHETSNANPVEVCFLILHIDRLKELLDLQPKQSPYSVSRVRHSSNCSQFHKFIILNRTCFQLCIPQNTKYLKQ